MKELIVTGNVGRHPEVRTDRDGNNYVNFSLGVRVGTKTNPKTDWVAVTCTGKLGDIATEHVKSGTMLLIKGFPTAHAYIKDGKPIGVQRLYANTIEMLSKKTNAQEKLATDNETPHDLPDPEKSAINVEPIPFS